MALISINRFNKFIKSNAAVVLFAAVLLTPSLSQAQSSGREMDNNDDEPAVQSGSATSGPWQNSAGSTIGGASSTERQNAANPNLGPGGGTVARPLSGPTPDATGGPGGNPDVPFDTNMNLMFLAGGVVFAYIVYRRRLKLKPVAAEKK
jgi:hypothetical protein